MEKYGFVYIWRDRKRSMYYIGCHWGHEDDGYICSSSWMMKTYKRRPADFKKRRILARVYTNRKDLLEEEYRWLSMIKNEELRVRYYNLHNHHFGHWSSNEKRELIIEKMSEANKEQISWMKGRTHTERAKIKMSLARQGKKHPEETKKKMSKSQTGKKQTEEAKQKIREARKKQAPPGAGKQRKIHKDNKTGHKGIYLTEYGRYRAQIRKDKKIYNCGSYITLEEAVVAYEKQLHSLYF